MTRSRLNLSIDETFKIIVIRYIGDMEGDDIHQGVIYQLSQVDKPWTYDTLFDLRRFDGAILASEIEDLGKRWALLAQGRDAGAFTAIISDDPLVKARMSITQSFFPHRTLQVFDNFDEGLDWLKMQRENVPQALAS